MGCVFVGLGQAAASTNEPRRERAMSGWIEAPTAQTKPRAGNRPGRETSWIPLLALAFTSECESQGHGRTGLGKAIASIKMPVS